MPGFEYGFNLHHPRLLATHRNAIMVGPATIEPSGAWNGTAASGFTTTPADPARTTAKPALRLIEPPHQYFLDTLTIGFAAAANDGDTLSPGLGIEKVIVHFEGNTEEILSPSLRTFNDINGVSRTYYGWWITLAKPAHAAGQAQVYAEAVANDPTMQRRVIGPFQFSPVAPFPATGTVHDYEIVLAPSQPVVAGASYQNATAAFSYLKAQAAQNPKITATEAASFTLPITSPIYQGNGYCTVEATAPISFVGPAYSTDTLAIFRPRYQRIKFTGGNVTLDFAMASELVKDTFGITNPGEYWFDGCNLTNSLGRTALWRLGQRPIAGLVQGDPWFTECNITNLPNVCPRVSLARGNTISGGYADVFIEANCVIGNVTSDWDGSFFTNELGALTVTGPAGSTLSLSGSNDGARTFTAKAGGSSVGTFAVGSAETYFTGSAGDGYTVQDVADWLNGLAGWSATVDDNSRRASAMGVAGGKGAAFTDIAVSSAVTFVTMFDVHPDWYSTINFSTRTENVLAYDNITTGITSQNIFLAGSNGAKDFIFFNNAFANRDDEYVDIVSSQLNYTHSHVLLAHNTMSRQGLSARSDAFYNGDAYCAVLNNALRTLAWGGAVDADVALAGNHLHAGSAAPGGSSGTTTGGDHTNLYVDAAAGNFAPAGALLANLAVPVVKYDLAGAARGATAAKGARA